MKHYNVKRILGMLGIVTALSCAMSAVTFAAWEKDGEQWRYRGSDNEYVKGSWVFDTGKNYYVNTDGVMVSGSYEVNGRVCVFNESGVLIDDSAPWQVEGLDSQLLELSRAKVNEYWNGIMTGYAMVILTREKNNVPPVALNYDMCIAATYRCQQMLNAGDFYSGPDEKGEMLWNSVTRAILRDPTFVGTENKSMPWTPDMPGVFNDADGGANNVFMTLNSQFESPEHFAQIVGPEYTQIGIGLYYKPDYMGMCVTEILRIGK